MFNVGISNMGSNGFVNMVLTSAECSDTILKELDKRALELGHIAPQILFEQILAEKGIRESDLMYADRKRIERKVEEVSAGGFRYE